MNCSECGESMTELDPREITDPQPSRFVPRWRCDEKECPAQGYVVEEVVWRVGDKFEWVHARHIGRSLELNLHHGVIEKITGPMAMVRLDGRSRRKQLPPNSSPCRKRRLRR